MFPSQAGIKKTPRIPNSKDRGYSWLQAADFCADKGMRLCSWNTVCKNGPGHEPIGNTAQADTDLLGDMWLPVHDAVNAYIQLKKKNAKSQCEKWTGTAANQDKKYGGPAWGMQKDNKYGLSVLCCATREIRGLPSSKYLIGPTPGISYKRAHGICHIKGQNLCRLGTYCPAGPGQPPLRGLVTSAHGFAPIADRHNEWVSLYAGTKGDRSCQTYTNLHKGLSAKEGFKVQFLRLCENFSLSLL